MFPHAQRLNGAAQEVPEIAQSLFEPNSWEKKLTETCYRQLAVTPVKGSAILFYSQKPGGVMDDMSLHGACPVLEGQKWGANLWVWNACRFGQCNGKGPGAGAKA